MEEDIANMSEDAFKTRVKESVRRYAYGILKTDCASKSKTKDLSYPKFELQQYLKVLPLKSLKLSAKRVQKHWKLRPILRFFSIHNYADYVV